MDYIAKRQYKIAGRGRQRARYIEVFLRQPEKTPQGWECELLFSGLEKLLDTRISSDDAMSALRLAIEFVDSLMAYTFEGRRVTVVS